MARRLVEDMSDAPGAPNHARRILAANRRLQDVLGSAASVPAALDILLHLATQPGDGAVTTTRCCDAIGAPRTTGLRWISALSAAGLIDQQEASADRRITLLRLSAKARAAITHWMVDVAGPPAEPDTPHGEMPRPDDTRTANGLRG